MKENVKIEIDYTESLFKRFFLRPLNYGVFGFAILFSVLIAVRFFSSIFDPTTFFRVEVSDVILSSLGFICFFLISVLNNFKQD